MITVQEVAKPDTVMASALEQFQSSEMATHNLAMVYEFEQYWLKERPRLRLFTLANFTRTDKRVHINVAISARTDTVSQLDTFNGFDKFCREQDLASVRLSEPLQLETLSIPKPWGQEVWYTAVEERGVCSVGGIPLPWLIHCFPDYVTGMAGDMSPILLKILDPHSQPVYGDLYFEMHREKTEVYIVTHVDKDAWPDGKGQIRYGFDRNKIEHYVSTTEFKQAYLAAVKDYQTTRREIDEQFDTLREQAGFEPRDPVPPVILSAWQERLPHSLRQLEADKRKRMEAFWGIRHLQVGDVVNVQPFTPHSLQHGVRVIEFQTPHYERFILSFAQKVLTQDDWDTEAALDQMVISPAWRSTFDPHEVHGATEENIASFDRFSVRRLTIQPGHTFTSEVDRYQLVIAVRGHIRVADQLLKEEQAVLLSAKAGLGSIFNPHTDESAICLLAAPHYQ